MSAEIQLKNFNVVDLFCGLGGASQGLLHFLMESGFTPEWFRSHGYRLQLYNVNHWEVAIETVQRNIAFAELYNAKIQDVDPTFVLKGERPHLVIAAPECFPAGTLIMTTAGQVPIEKVKIGDIVLTHTGRWKFVTGTMKRQANTKIVSGYGNSHLETTAEHPFYTTTRSRQWNNERRDYDTFYSKPAWTATRDLVAKSTYWGTPTKFAKVATPDFPVGIWDDPKIWWFIGRWLGDGSVTFRRRTADLSICCGNHEADELEETLAKLEGLRFARRHLRTATLFTTQRLAISRWLVEHFGEGAQGKHLPAWIYSLDRDSRSALLEGYMSADGSINNRHERTAQTVSKALAIDMRMLAASLGHHVALTHITNVNTVIEGRTVNAKDAYRIAWFEPNTRMKNSAAFEDILWGRIHSVQDGRDNVTVYNLEVADDNSYVADGIVVHNCIMHSQARGNKPIKDQSRTTAAWVLDWLDLKPDALFFENVPEWRNWTVLDEHMRPIKERRGEYYQGFLRAIKRRGYVLSDQVVRCDLYGDATIRKRLFILGMQKEIANRVGMRAMSFPEPTHTATPEKHPHRKPRRVARDIINWNRKGRPITHRPGGPHAVPTLRRVRNGFYKQQRLLAPAAVELIDRLMPIAEAFHVEMEAIATKHRLGRAVTKEESRQNAIIRLNARENAAAAVTEAYRDPLARIYTKDLATEERLAIEAITLGQHGGATAHTESEPIATVATKGAIALYETAQSFLVKANASDSSSFGDAVQAIDAPMNTIVTKDCRAVVEPFVAQLYSSNVNAGGADSVDTPLSTITAGGVHQALTEPVIAKVYGERRLGDARTQDLDAPLSTITAGGNHHAVAETLLLSHHGSRHGESRATSINDPVPTATASGAGYIVEPAIIARNNAEAGGERRARSVNEPLATATGRGSGYLADPILAIVQHGKDDTREPSLDDPLHTITSKGSTVVAEPFIVPQDGRCNDIRSVDEPTPTATTIARIGFAEAFVVSNHFNNGGTSVEEPLGTATTGNCLGLVDACITPNFGERENQAPRIHPIDEPLPAITSHGAGMLSAPVVTLPEDGPYILIDDVPYSFNILYRMLHSSELAAAHSLQNVVLPDCEQDAVKLVGNSIPKCTAAALIGHVLTPILRLFDEDCEVAA